MGLIPVYIANEFLEEQFLYQMLLYLPLPILKAAGEGAINRIVEQAENAKMNAEVNAEQDRAGTDDKQADQNAAAGVLPYMKQILQNRPELGDSRMEFMSWLDRDQNGDPDYPTNGLLSCVVVSPDSGSLCIVFRGTPKGAWLDNAKMLIGDPEYSRKFTDLSGNEWNYLSPMQAEAMEYIKAVLWSYGPYWREYRYHYIIGHSKGGNQAQLGGIIYQAYFDLSISANGPGMSNELQQEMQEILGSGGFYAAAARITALNAANDFVHGLGAQIVQPATTVWFDGYEYGAPILGSHAIQTFIDQATGLLAPFAVGPGPVSRYISKLSSVAMELPLADKSAVFMTLMGFAQVFLGKSAPVNPEDEDWIRFAADIDDGILKGMGLILCVTLNTQEGKDFLTYLNSRDVGEQLESFFGSIITWYRSQSVSQQVKTAKGIAMVMILKLVLIAAMTKLVTMAELLALFRSVWKELEIFGASILDIYRDMVGVFVQDYVSALETTGDVLR